MKITSKKEYEEAKEELSGECSAKPCEYYKQLEKAIEEYEDETFYDYYGNFIIPKEERILISAVFYNDEVITNFRHGECLTLLQRLYPECDFSTVVCGFLTNHNRFVDRKEGFKIAKKMDQIIHDFHHKEDININFGNGKNPPVENQLTSEDLW